MKKKIIINLVKAIGIIVLSVFLTMVLFQRFKPNADFFGYRMFVIVSNSMKPSLTVGDVILVKTTDAKDIKVKDTITYKGQQGDFRGMVITHQVVNIQTEKSPIDGKGSYIFYTKGTNNTLIDSQAVYEEQIYGVKVYKFFLISLISKVIRNTFGLLLFVVLPLSLLFIFEIMDIRRELQERRK
jgi:signal peptidase I